MVCPLLPASDAGMSITHRQSSGELLTVSAMARRLGVKTTWLRDEAEAGRLPCVPAGETYLFDAVTVERVLLDRARGGEGQR